MRYRSISPATFLDRPNRFIAHCDLGGETVTVHVKNTGRCRELLVPGTTVYLEKGDRPGRKTAWDLVAVRKGAKLINMDAAAPNAVAAEWIHRGGLGFVPTALRPEVRFGDSRFDFYLERDGRPGYAEVKGVTLEEGGVVRFPDAPTLRGVKHLRGLAEAARQGLETHVIFIVQMADVRYFAPNRATQPEFADALRETAEAGVQLHCIDCAVTEDSIVPGRPVDIHI